jgi:hypothetical protein
MISQEAKWVNPDFQYNPSPEDMKNQLQKFSGNILDASRSFGRWFKGFCEIVPRKVGEENTD